MTAAELHNFGWTPDADEALRQMRASRLTQAQIADRLGCSPKRIQRRLHRLGLGEPSPGNPNWRLP